MPDHKPKTYPAIDPRMFQTCQGVCLEATPPRKAGPVLAQEKPWESFYMHPHTLVYHEGEYLLYYLVCIVNDGPARNQTCLAVSRDGLHWSRPELGQVEFAGSRANNILAVGGTVSIDPMASPDDRFLMAGPDAQTRPGEPGFVLEGICLHTSPDGRRWRQRSPVLTPFTCDSTNQVFWDSNKGKYVAYLRACPPNMGRAVAYYETENVFDPWPIKPSATNVAGRYTMPYGLVQDIHYLCDELPIVLSGRPGLEPYNPAVQPLGDLYVAFPDVFRIFPGPEDPNKEKFPDAEPFAWFNDGLVAPRLFVSADGLSFQPVGDGPYIDLGVQEALDSRQVRMVTGWVERGDEWWQYYGGHQTGHTLARGRRPRKACAVMRAIQRRDGLAAWVAGPSKGKVVTAPVAMTGRRLSVNFDAGAWGQVRVQLVDPEGRPVPDYSFADSLPLMGNTVYEPVRWAYGRDLGPLAHRPVCIEFELTRAMLFSWMIH